MPTKNPLGALPPVCTQTLSLRNVERAGQPKGFSVVPIQSATIENNFGHWREWTRTGLRRCNRSLFLQCQWMYCNLSCMPGNRINKHGGNGCTSKRAAFRICADNHQCTKVCRFRTLDCRYNYLYRKLARCRAFLNFNFFFLIFLVKEPTTEYCASIHLTLSAHPQNLKHLKKYAQYIYM